MSGELVRILLWAVVLVSVVVAARWRRDGVAGPQSRAARLLALLLFVVALAFTGMAIFGGGRG